MIELQTLMCLSVITFWKLIPTTGKGTNCELWNYLCMWGSPAWSSFGRGKLCSLACDAPLQFPHSDLMSVFTEEFHIFGLHNTLYDILGGDCFIVTDTFWHLWTVFFLSSLINAVLCHFYVDASMHPQYLCLWYVIRTAFRILMTRPYTAWYFLSLMYGICESYQQFNPQAILQADTHVLILPFVELCIDMRILEWHT
jgi:hypothetical protein